MKKTLKIITGLLAAVAILIVLAAVVLPMIVDPNDYRDEIAARAEAATGRPMQIEGELRLSVIPWLGVEIGRVSVGNPAGFGEAPFLVVESAAVGARLFPLLSRRLEVSTVRLEGLQLALVKGRDGRGNWEGFGSGDGAPRSEGAGAAGPAFRIAGIAGLEISDARVSFEDQAAGSVIEASVPRLVTGALVPGEPFEIAGEADVAMGAPRTRVAAEFAARVLAAEDFSAVTVKGPEIRVRGERAEEALGFEGEARADAVEIDLSALEGTASGFSAVASASGPDTGRHRASLSSPSVRFGFSGPSTTASQVEASAVLELPGSPRHELTLTAPSLGLDLNKQVLSAPEFAAVMDGVGLAGKLEGTRIVDAPRFTGAFQLAEFSPRKLMERLAIEPPPTSDPGVLAHARMESRFSWAERTIALEGMDLVLDDTRLTGKAAVGTGQPTRVEATLDVDAIDLDRYLPPAGEEQEGSGASGQDSELAFDWLNDLSMDASVGIGQLGVSGLKVTAVKARAAARGGVLTIDPLTAALYGGTVTGRVRLDARQSPAEFTLDQSLRSLAVGPFAADLAGFDRLQGTATLDASLSTRARTTAGLMEGLNGTLAFDVTDGVYQGVNIWYEIQRAYALIKGRPAPEKTSPDTTFRDIRGSAVIRDGVLVNDDLVAGLEALALNGAGKVDLARSEMDYRLEATVRRQVRDDATGEVSELAGERLPLKLTGRLASPKVSVALEDVIRREAEKKVLEKLGVESEQGQSAEDALKEKAKEKLKKLFGGDG
jgi:AsmA protein